MVFAALFLLSEAVFLWHPEGQPGWLGFPPWLGLMIGLQIALVIGLLVFVRKYWKEDE